MRDLQYFCEFQPEVLVLKDRAINIAKVGYVLRYMYILVFTCVIADW